MLEVTGLEVAYGSHRAVQGLSLSLSPGKVVALVGANGAGKTSTLSALSGVLRPSGGTVRLDGTDVTSWGSHKMVRAGVSHVPEGRRIIAPLTVEENLLLGAYARRRNREGIKATMEEVHGLFPILHDRANSAAGLLSGGEQQMLAFGRALMAAPKVMLLDEPTMGLAPALVGVVLDSVSRLRELGIAVLLVEQNGAAVVEVADYVHLLERGAPVGEGAPSELDDDSIMRALLGITDLEDGLAGAPSG